MGDLEEVWTATTDPGSTSGIVTSNQGVHPLVQSEGRLYLYGIDRQTGSQLWRAPIAIPGFEDLPLYVSRPVFADDAIWVGYGVPNLGGNYTSTALDPNTGEIIAASPDLGGLVDGLRGSRYVTRQPAVASSPNPIGALRVTVGDLEDPDVGWSANIYGGSLSDLGDPGQLTLGQNAVYQAGPGFFDDGTGGVMRGNGLRSYSIEGPEGCGSQSPCLPTWAIELDGTTAATPVVAREDGGVSDVTVFTATDAGTVYAVDAASGELEWSSAIGGSADTLALANGRLYVPAADKLIVLDADSGDTLWETTTGGTPAVAGGVVYAADGEDVSAFDASGCGEATCEPLWSASTGTHITDGPAIDRGQVYIATQDGELIAYGLPE